MTLGPFVGHDEGVSTVSEVKVEFWRGWDYVDMRFGDQWVGWFGSVRDGERWCLREMVCRVE